MVSKWLHLDERLGDPWILPIYAALNEAIQQGKLGDLSGDMKELGLALSIRLNILPCVVDRINQEVSMLYQECKKHGPEHVFDSKTHGYAFPVNNELKYQLLTDIDSLLFELNSCCDLLNRFFQALYRHAGQVLDDKHVGPRLRRIIMDAGHDPSWFVKLDSHRNFLIHNAAPYLAVNLTNEPHSYDILVMRGNIIDFADQSRFFSLSELNNIVQGFQASKPVVQADLVSLLKHQVITAGSRGRP